MNLLFIGAPDAQPFIEPIMARLRVLDHECFTHEQRLKQARLGTPIVRVLEAIVESADAVIVFASPNFHSDAHALWLLDLATAQGNLVAIVPPWEKQVSMPANFFSGSLLIATKKDHKKIAKLILEALQKLS